MELHGPKVRSRYLYASVQCALRRYAAMGITLEVDEDGVPVLPSNRAMCHRGEEIRFPESLPSSMPTTVLQDSQHLGKYVRIWRERCALSLQQASLEAGLGMRFLSEFERGKPTVRLEKVMAALDALGLEILIRPRR